MIGPQCSVDIPKVPQYQMLASRCSILRYACLWLAKGMCSYLLGSVIFHFRANIEKLSIFLWLRLRCLSKTQRRVLLEESNTSSQVSHMGRVVNPPSISPDGRKGRGKGSWSSSHRLKRREKFSITERMRDPALQGEAKSSGTLESGLVQLSDVSLVKILPQRGLKMPIMVYATRVVSPTTEYQ